MTNPFPPTLKSYDFKYMPHPYFNKKHIDGVVVEVRGCMLQVAGLIPAKACGPNNKILD